MSDREILLKEVQKLPEYQVSYVLGVIRELGTEIPNEETLESFKEMETGECKTFDNADELFADMGM